MKKPKNPKVKLTKKPRTFELNMTGARSGSFGMAVLLGCFKLLCLFSFLTPQTSTALQMEVDGRPFIALTTVGSHFGMCGHWVQPDEVYRLSSNQTTIDFVKKSRLIKLNQMPVYLGFSTVEMDGILFMSVADYLHVLQPILTPQVFKRKPGVRRVVIDVGHGDKDTGARNDDYGLLEKDLVMDVSIRLKQLLKQSGFQVALTRSSDVFIPLEERPAMANRYGADLFVSLHFNSAASPEPSGFEVFALTPQYQPSTSKPKPTEGDAERFLGNKYDPWNMLAAYHVQRALVQQGIGELDRGVKRARFMVLKHLDCPGVLVELGFLSHVKTARKVRSAKYRQLLAQGLCEGILTYCERLQRIR